MAGEPRGLCAQHGFGRGRDELHRAVAAVTRNHVAHVARQQAITVFLDIEQRYAGARQRFRAERQTRGIERRRSHARRHQHAAQQRVRFGGRQQVEMTKRDQQRGAGQRQRRGKRDHAARGRQRGFERNHDQPDRGERFDTAGGHRDHHHQTGQRQRRQDMRAFVAAGARQEPGQQDRRDQPGKGRDLDRRRRAAQRQIDRKRRQRHQAAEQPRRHERAMARERIIARRGMQQRIETIADDTQNNHSTRASAWSSNRRAGTPPLSLRHRVRANLSER